MWAFQGPFGNKVGKSLNLPIREFRTPPTKRGTLKRKEGKGKLSSRIIKRGFPTPVEGNTLSFRKREIPHPNQLRNLGKEEPPLRRRISPEKLEWGEIRRTLNLKT